ncbi:hypothetical protein OAO87_02935 [bacterium]|nr:hypothetical protein [bacterium]
MGACMLWHTRPQRDRCKIAARWMKDERRVKMHATAAHRVRALVGVEVGH